MNKKIYISTIIFFVVLVFCFIILINEVKSEVHKQTDVERLEILREESKQWKFFNIKEDYTDSNKKKKLIELLVQLEEQDVITYEERIKLSRGESVIIAGEEFDISEIVSNPGDETEVLRNNIGTIIGRKICDGESSEIPIPDGFYYVGGSVSTGIIISDNIEDENKYQYSDIVGYDLIGNQYLWIFTNYNIAENNDEYKGFELKNVNIINIEESIQQYKGIYIERQTSNNKIEAINVSKASLEEIDINNVTDNVIYLDVEYINSLENVKDKKINLPNIIYINR